MTEAEEQKKVDVEKDEVQVRGEAFLEDYKKLLDKHDYDFVSFPQFIPDGQGGFKVVVQTVPVDTKNQPKKSPFVAS